MLNLGILISGGGTTLQNLADLMNKQELDAKITVVIASNPTCYGITRAKNLNLPIHIITRKQSASLEDFSTKIVHTLRQYHVDLTLMAGFLSLWTIPQELTGRVL